MGNHSVTEATLEMGDQPPPKGLDKHLHPMWRDMIKRRPKSLWSTIDLRLLERALKYIGELEELDKQIEDEGYHIDTPQGVQLSIAFRARGKIEAQVNTLMQRLGITAQQEQARRALARSRDSSAKQSMAQQARDTTADAGGGLLARRTPGAVAH